MSFKQNIFTKFLSWLIGDRVVMYPNGEPIMTLDEELRNLASAVVLAQAGDPIAKAFVLSYVDKTWNALVIGSSVIADLQNQETN